MKKRTKIELIVFAIVAVIYLFGLFIEKQANHESTAVPEVTESAAIVNSDGGGDAEQLSAEADEDGTYAGEDVTHADGNGTHVEEAGGTYAGEDDTYADDDTYVDEDGTYTDAGHVAAYLHEYGHLPSNFITKSEARAAGWDSSEGNLDEVCPGMSIGGDRFGNYEGRLPDKNGRTYYECDINYDPDYGYRGGERIIYSNDGLIYYTDDHYESFELMYGQE